MGNEANINCLYDEISGKSLTSILTELAKANPSVVNEPSAITTDDIVSKSLMRNKSHVCASKIVKRDFTYALSISQNSVLVSWDFLDVISSLPEGYKSATTGVKITGLANGSTFSAESKSPSAGLSVLAANFPVSVNIALRVTSPCGNIDLTSQLNLSNPIETGEFRTSFAAQDLNPQTGQIKLTQQIDSIESQLASALLQLKTQKELIDDLITRL